MNSDKAHIRAVFPYVLGIAGALAAGVLLALVFSRGMSPRISFPLAAPAQGRLSAGAGAQDSQVLDVFAAPRSLPSFSFADASGQTLTLAAFRGRVVLLNIWATWCVPCREEMPALDRLAREFGGADFMVLPLSIDRGGVPAVRGFYEKHDLSALPIYLDRSARVTSKLEIPGLPTTFLIDREGYGIARKIGPADWADPEMQAIIRRLLPLSHHNPTQVRL